MAEEKTYLGDGVYASFDGYQVWVHVERDLDVWSSIALESDVLDALVDYDHKTRQARFAQQMAEKDVGGE